MATTPPASSTTLIEAQWDESKIPNMRGKVVIVTGANSGIGFRTAQILAANDATVVLACRSQQRGEQACADITRAVPGARLDLMALDLSSLDSVRSFADTFQGKYSRLDLLINNAGVMYPVKTHTADGKEMQLAVNHLGHFLLTKLLFELLCQGEPSRIVTLSSFGHRLAFHPDFATALTPKRNKWFYFDEYNVSKLCNLLFTYELDRRIRAAGMAHQVMAVASHPGFTATNLMPHVVEGYFPRALHGPLCKLVGVLPMFQPVTQGTVPTLFAATAPSVVGGDYYGPNGFTTLAGKAPAKETSSKLSYSEELATKLWTFSEEVVGATFTVKSSS